MSRWRRSGLTCAQHDLKFEEDNWEWPVGGAWGVGWQVMLDGLEITQFTYFQQCGGMDLDPIAGEITYGLERIAGFLQDVDSIYDIVWARQPDTGVETTYGEMRLAEEEQFSSYGFDYADVPSLWKHLELYEAECLGLLERARGFEKMEALELKRFPVLGAYELALKCSQIFQPAGCPGGDFGDGAGGGDGADSDAGGGGGEGVCGAGGDGVAVF